MFIGFIEGGGTYERKIHIVSSIISFVLIHRDTVGLIGEDFSEGLWEMLIFTWISTVKHYLKNKSIYH